MATWIVPFVFREKLLLALDFLQFPCWDCLELLPFLVHCSFCIQNFHCLRQKNTCGNQVVMSYRSETFARNAIFMFCEWRRFRSLLCGFMRFSNATTKRFGNLLGCNFMLCSHFPGASLSFPSARHGGCNRSFQFSPRIYESFFVMLVIRINKVKNSSQSSSIVGFGLLVFPFLFFSILSGFTNFGPLVWPYMIWSGSRLNFCCSLTGPQKSFGRFFLSIE